MPRIKASSGVGGVGNIKIGTYIGNGLATQSITLVGFTPQYLKIWRQNDTVSRTPAQKITNDLLNSCVANWSGGGIIYSTDHIISVDVDGFTVGDGTGFTNILNVNLVVYTYVAFG